MPKRKRAPQYRMLANIDRDGRRYEAGKVYELDWPNIDEVLAWGVIQLAEDAEDLPFADPADDEGET